MPVFIDDGSTDSDPAFGLGNSTNYCYSVSTNNSNGDEGPESDSVCAATLPLFTVGLGLEVEVDNASSMGSIGVGLMSLWGVSGYQFDISVTGSFGETFTIIDAGLCPYGWTCEFANGTFIAFDLTGVNPLMPTYPNISGAAGFAFVANENDFDGLNVTIDNFVFAEYNLFTNDAGNALNACDVGLFLDPDNFNINNCGSLTYEDPDFNVDSNDVWGGDFGCCEFDDECDDGQWCDNGECVDGGTPECIMDCPDFEFVDGDNDLSSEEACTII
jgi:hypothetical protein